MQQTGTAVYEQAYLVGDVIHWELGKWLNFDHLDKPYMHRLESFLENEVPKIPWDYEIQTDKWFVGQPGFFGLSKSTNLGEEKLWILTKCTPLKKRPYLTCCCCGGVG